MLMQNEFDGRDEVIFIEYDKVIKNSDQFLIHKLGGQLKDLYSGILATEDIAGIDMSNSLGMTMMTMDPNIFVSLRKDDGSLPEGWLDNYIGLYKMYPEMFEECDTLSIGSNLHTLTRQKFTKRVIIWTPFEDRRVTTDIVRRHGELKNIEYFHGSISEVFNLIGEKITTFIIGNHELLPFIKEYDKLDYTEILLAKYRFNQVRLDNTLVSRYDEEFFEGNVVKFANFEPFKLKGEHLNQLIKKD